MKALSIRQPWAWLIVRPDLTGQARLDAIARREVKDIENRSWQTNHRGPTLIHAAKGMTRAEYEDVQDFLHDLHLYDGVGDEFIQLPKLDELQRGGIVGWANIVNCVPSAQADSPWHMEGQYGFRLVDAKPVPFVPLTGRLNFFDVPNEILGTIVRDTAAIA